ncbi:disulfide bond formation protein B [Legionella parisiensis]|uniref:Disulfide bond formation protein B n=1 Tax=Legionella parisiensis TaxID=45071 RepID=A0A1E5JRA3_9GAMM|nr:disulfide bond formation protein B [Legionella parisiensis]KTD44797.1 disulfide bond formation protein DsbB [Legionella parisiensis]OEH47049.1 Disulfide bond formation protein B [Legionella parisiensis]STX71780.1 disulfide bond formation protein DsbB [Legionella parisiensis]
MRKITYRKIQTFNAMLTLFVLFASFYFQYVVGLTPCPLCIMQRVCVLLLLAVMGLSFRTLKRARIISVLQVIIACAGLYFALRQLWLQSLPEGEAPACMPGLDILIRYFPWQTVVKTLFWGTADCAEVSWQMLGISMPGWCALYFLFMVLTGCFLFWNTRKSVLHDDSL